MKLMPRIAVEFVTRHMGVRDPMDGKLVFVNDAQRGDDTVSYRQLFSSTLRDAVPTQITSGPYNHSDPSVSEDGQLIAYVSERTGSGSEPVSRPA